MSALNVPPATDQLVAVAVALRLVSLPPVSTRPGLAVVPSVNASDLPPLKTSLAEPAILRLSLEEVYWVVTLVALKVPPATVQLAAVAVAFRLSSWPPVSTRPGLAFEPRVRARVLPPSKTSLALPEILNWSLEEVYWAVTLVALKVPPATVQLVAVAVALRLVSVLLVSTSPGLSVVPRVSARDLPPLNTSEAVPEIESTSPVEE